MIKVINKVEEVIDFVWNLSEDDFYASYPRIKSLGHIKKDLQRAISSLINEMLMELYNEFGVVKEIIYFIDEDSTEELNSALSSGFEIYERYRCYKCLL